MARSSVWRGSCLNAMLVVWLVADSRRQRPAAGTRMKASLAIISSHSELTGRWLERVCGVGGDKDAIDLWRNSNEGWAAG